MTIIKPIGTALSIREQAQVEVNKELATKAIEKMKSKLKELAAAQTVVKAIELQIDDLEQQIKDGTL